MSDQTKFLLSENDLPKAWYNLLADLPFNCRLCCTLAPNSLSDQMIWHLCFPCL